MRLPARMHPNKSMGFSELFVGRKVKNGLRRADLWYEVVEFAPKKGSVTWGRLLPMKKSYQQVVPIGSFVSESPVCSQTFRERYSAGHIQDNQKERELT